MKKNALGYTFFFLIFSFPVGDVLAQSGTAANRADYPTRAIRMIVPFPPGGSDTVARLIAQRLNEQLGQQVVVDNRPGAAGVIGTQLAAQAPADGYTLLFITASLTIVPNSARLPYDLSRDFAPISPLATAPLLIVVHPSVPARSVNELIQLAKARPGQLNYASSGTGSITHLAAALFSTVTGSRLVHIPYKGTGPAQTDVIAGDVQIMFGILGPALPFVRSGKLIGLGVTSSQRSTLAPDVPTVSEAGVPGYEAATWYGMLAPGKTPEPILAQLHGKVRTVVMSPDIVSRLAATGFEPMPAMDRKEFGNYIRTEIAKWSNLIKTTNIVLE